MDEPKTGTEATTMRLRLLRTVVIGVVLAALLAACHGGTHVKPVAGGLEYPAAFTLGETGDIIWYAERHTGEIHRRNVVNGNDRLVWTIPNIASAGEQGLLGIALHPNYPSQPYVYAFATRTVWESRRTRS